MTCDMGGKNYSDMRHGPFLNSTCDIGENKQQRHATLPFRILRKSTCDIEDPHQGPQEEAAVVER